MDYRWLVQRIRSRRWFQSLVIISVRRGTLFLRNDYFLQANGGVLKGSNQYWHYTDAKIMLALLTLWFLYCPMRFLYFVWICPVTGYPLTIQRVGSILCTGMVLLCYVELPNISNGARLASGLTLYHSVHS